MKALKDDDELPENFIRFVVQMETGFYQKYPQNIRSAIQKHMAKRTLGDMKSATLVEYLVKSDIDNQSYLERVKATQKFKRDSVLGYYRDVYETLIGEKPKF